MRKQGLDRMVKLGLLAAMSIILAVLVHFPIFPAAPFLEYDMADVPILIGTFLYGPWWGLLLTSVVCILQGVTVSAGSNIIGILMHLLATGGFVIVAGLIYQRQSFHTFKGALLALTCGALTMVALMVPLNLVFTGLFIGRPMDIIWSMMLPVIVPFNAIKAFGNAIITLLLYKSIGKVLKIEIVKSAV
ncbi:MAG: ECF transporter S component [Clostridia bacterium]